MISTETRLKVAEFLERNEKINAIKYIREQYSLSLKDALTEVQSVEDEFFPGRSSMKIAVPKLIGRIFTGIGTAFIIVSLVLYWNDQQAMKNAVILTGKVTDLNYGSNGTAAPVVTYSDNGIEKQLHGSTWTSPPAFSIDEKVELIKSSENPDKIIINSFSERYFLMAFMAGFGVVFAGIGLLVTIFLKK